MFFTWKYGWCCISCRYESPRITENIAITGNVDVTGEVLHIAETTLTDGATINWDMSSQSVCKVTLIEQWQQMVAQEMVRNTRRNRFKNINMERSLRV